MTYDLFRTCSCKSLIECASACYSDKLRRSDAAQKKRCVLKRSIFKNTNYYLSDIPNQNDWGAEYLHRWYCRHIFIGRSLVPEQYQNKHLSISFFLNFHRLHLVLPFSTRSGVFFKSLETLVYIAFSNTLLELANI